MIAMLLMLSFATLPDRVVVVREPPGKLFGFPDDRQWTPSERHIIILEQHLGEYLASHDDPRAKALAPKWKDYVRQYGGGIIGESRIIQGNFACDRQGRVDSAKKQWIVVDDGGDCYFQLKWDPETRHFTELSINGDA